MGESQNADPYAPAIADLEAKIAELQTALKTLKSIRSVALGAGPIGGVSTPSAGTTMDGTAWNDTGGVYIFAGVANGYWRAKYVGMTESFKTRHPDHERWTEAQRLGATHVHAMVVSQEASRVAIEKELIGKLQPPLNTHHR